MTDKDKRIISKKIKALVELFTQNNFEEISQKYPNAYNLSIEEIRDSVESYTDN